MLRQSDTDWRADLESDLLGVTAQAGQRCWVLSIKKFLTYDGKTWMPPATTLAKRSTVVVDAKTTGTFAIYTLETTDLVFFPTSVVPRSVDIRGVTVPPTVSLGTVSPNYDDVAAASALSTLLATLGAGSGIPMSPVFSPPLAGGTVIYAKVSGAALATAYRVKYDVVGYYDTQA